MKKFKLTEALFKGCLSKEDTLRLMKFFYEKKYLKSEDVLTIRFFMYYQNYYIELPNNLEEKRRDIFKCINKLDFTDHDFMDSKADFKKKPVGFKD